jgi:signal transduction histidine kinase
MEDGTEARFHRAMTHELRIPLTVLTGRVQLLRRRLRQGRDPARLEADLTEIELALVRLAATVDRLDGLA